MKFSPEKVMIDRVRSVTDPRKKWCARQAINPVSSVVAYGRWRWQAARNLRRLLDGKT